VQVSSINAGIVALVGLKSTDTETDLMYCAKKLIGCKLWSNETDKPWRTSVVARDYEILCVSQFTLYGTLNKKNVPDYKLSMKSDQATLLYDRFKTLLGEMHKPERVKDGVFGAHMDVALVNDGPVTLVVDSEDDQRSTVAAAEAQAGTETVKETEPDPQAANLP
jgi:D-tyrosyl-tRNA(Tyr) deacylase